jgi:hypothetical protein
MGESNINISHVKSIFKTGFDVAQYLIALTKFIVHFGLTQNEPKDQGDESIVGGLFINAATFEWSMRLTDSNQSLSR